LKKKSALERSEILNRGKRHIKVSKLNIKLGDANFGFLDHNDKNKNDKFTSWRALYKKYVLSTDVSKINIYKAYN